MKNPPKIHRYETSEGGVIFQLPLNAFPDFWVYAYVVLVDDYKVLIDTGSNYHESNQNLEDGFKQIGEMLGSPLGLEDLTHVFVTHGHIDHFAGLAYIHSRSKAKSGVHELDLRNLTNYEERLVVAAWRLRTFLFESGVSQERVEQLLDMYMMPKALFKSVEVDFTFEEVGMTVGPFEFIHVPGHCAGAVVIRLHDVMFTGDHVLSDITPHQSPERLTLNTGLGHYINSLKSLKTRSGGVNLSLGSHKDPIRDINVRIDEILTSHVERLEKIHAMLDQPMTVLEVSKALFGKADGYNALLALQEAGAHIEYLYQRGMLSIANLDDIQSNGTITPIQYSRLSEDISLGSVFP